MKSQGLLGHEKERTWFWGVLGGWIRYGKSENPERPQRTLNRYLDPKKSNVVFICIRLLPDCGSSSRTLQRWSSSICISPSCPILVFFRSRILPTCSLNWSISEGMRIVSLNRFQVWLIGSSKLLTSITYLHWITMASRFVTVNCPEWRAIFRHRLQKKQ